MAPSRGPVPSDDLLLTAYRRDRVGTRAAVRSGLYLALIGAAIVVLSLFLSARGYYFLGLLALLAWSAAGFFGSSRRGLLSGLWTGLVIGAVGGMVTLLAALLVHGGRLALFGVTDTVANVVNNGPVSQFFGTIGPGSAANAVTGIGYIVYVSVFFLTVLALGTSLSAVSGAVAAAVGGAEAGKPDKNDGRDEDSASAEGSSTK